MQSTTMEISDKVQRATFNEQLPIVRERRQCDRDG